MCTHTQIFINTNDDAKIILGNISLIVFAIVIVLLYCNRLDSVQLCRYHSWALRCGDRSSFYFSLIILFLVSHFNFLFIPCGRLSWLPVSFLLHVKYPLSYRTMGTTVGSLKFTDHDYADDAVLFSDCPSKWPYILSSFDEAAHTMGLNTSWSKTKIQNLGHRVTPAPVQLQGHIVESTDRFTYLGSDNWYPLVWAFHHRDTQAHRSSFKYFRQTGQRLEADWVYRRRYGFTMPLSSPYCYMAPRHGLSWRLTNGD